MPSHVEFVQRLLTSGRVVHHGRPSPVVEPSPAVLGLLEAAFDDHALDLAGPAIWFDAGSALRALELVRQASWFLVSRSEAPEEVERALTTSSVPRTASEHLSADLCLRFLPVLYRRARSMASSDRMTELLAEIFRRWPLSGVLADLEAGPGDVGDLGDHPGLWMLYAERLARAEKPGWMPLGRGRDHVELVFRGLGKPRSPVFNQASGTDPGEGE